MGAALDISIINHTDGEISDTELQQVLRAINRQIAEDFEPAWGMGARMRLDGRTVNAPDSMTSADVRGDAVIYLWNHATVKDALGYHDKSNRGLPDGYVFTTLCKQLGESWTVTLSHEVLELIADPESNLLVMGRHPTERRNVFYWYEMCDPVQTQTYMIDGVEVSNFVLPLYFVGARQKNLTGARTDFLATREAGGTLKPFGVSPGGYVGYYDPVERKTHSYSARGDRVAAHRAELRAGIGLASRSGRYRTNLEEMKGTNMPGGKSIHSIPKKTKPVARKPAKKKAAKKKTSAPLRANGGQKS